MSDAVGNEAMTATLTVRDTHGTSFAVTDTSTYATIGASRSGAPIILPKQLATDGTYEWTLTVRVTGLVGGVAPPRFSLALPRAPKLATFYEKMGVFSFFGVYVANEAFEPLVFRDDQSGVGSCYQPFHFGQDATPPSSLSDNELRKARRDNTMWKLGATTDGRANTASFVRFHPGRTYMLAPVWGDALPPEQQHFLTNQSVTLNGPPRTPPPNALRFNGWTQQPTGAWVTSATFTTPAFSHAVQQERLMVAVRLNLAWADIDVTETPSTCVQTSTPLVLNAISDDVGTVYFGDDTTGVRDGSTVFIHDDCVPLRQLRLIPRELFVVNRVAESGYDRFPLFPSAPGAPRPGIARFLHKGDRPAIGRSLIPQISGGDLTQTLGVTKWFERSFIVVWQWVTDGGQVFEFVDPIPSVWLREDGLGGTDLNAFSVAALTTFERESLRYADAISTARLQPSGAASVTTDATETVPAALNPAALQGTRGSLRVFVARAVQLPNRAGANLAYTVVAARVFTDLQMTNCSAGLSSAHDVTLVDVTFDGVPATDNALLPAGRAVHVVATPLSPPHDPSLPVNGTVCFPGRTTERRYTRPRREVQVTCRGPSGSVAQMATVVTDTNVRQALPIDSGHDVVFHPDELVVEAPPPRDARTIDVTLHYDGQRGAYVGTVDIDDQAADDSRALAALQLTVLGSCRSYYATGLTFQRVVAGKHPVDLTTFAVRHIPDYLQSIGRGRTEHQSRRVDWPLSVGDDFSVALEVNDPRSPFSARIRPADGSKLVAQWSTADGQVQRTWHVQPTTAQDTTEMSVFRWRLDNLADVRALSGRSGTWAFTVVYLDGRSETRLWAMEFSAFELASSSPSSPGLTL